MRSRIVLGSVLGIVALALLILSLPHKAPAAEQKSDMVPPAMVSMPVAGDSLEAYVAWPVGTAKVPTVLIVQEWWGLDDHIKDIARRMSREGYLAIVPDLYHGKVAETPEVAHELVRGLEDTRVFAELATAAAWARSQQRSADGRMGIMGFCVGGGITLRYAIQDPKLSAAVMFYGPPESDPAKLATLKAPLQGHFGMLDQGIPPDHVDAMRAALKKAGKTADLYEYAGAGHAFMHDGRPSYHAESAKVAWARTLGFLQRYLKG